MAKNFGFGDLKAVNNQLAEDHNDSKWRKCKNVAGAFCQIKEFDNRYAELFAELLFAGETNLSEEYLDQQIRMDLNLDYEDDCHLAMLKFDAFAHCMYLEESVSSWIPFPLMHIYLFRYYYQSLCLL